LSSRVILFVILRSCLIKEDITTIGCWTKNYIFQKFARFYNNWQHELCFLYSNALIIMSTYTPPDFGRMNFFSSLR
jgi:hypothetical protein